jgi:hypothetical protein
MTDTERDGTMKTKAIGYWATTGLLLFGVLSGGICELVRRPENVQGMVQLGYPVYVVTILGLWKVLGTVALLAPGFPRLKEWAYAGIIFNMTGAAASHAACGDAVWHVVVTLAFAALAVASWALRPPSRTLGVLFQGKEQPA